MHTQTHTPTDIHICICPESTGQMDRKIDKRKGERERPAIFKCANLLITHKICGVTEKGLMMFLQTDMYLFQNVSKQIFPLELLHKKRCCANVHR